MLNLKPRGFVPWGLPGPTRRRRDAAALASKTSEEDCSDGGEGPGRGHRDGGTHIIGQNGVVDAPI